MSETPAEVPSNEANGAGEQRGIADGVLFRTKKRGYKKARTKVRVREDEDQPGEDDQPEMTVSEMMILKEAQELREQTRMTSFASGGRDKGAKKPDGEDEGDGADDSIGLKESFAVEKSSHIAEERMSRYVEERMAEKLKYRRKKDDGKKTKSADDIYAIPDRLKVEEKPLYDPGEGLPPAGIEEVALADEVRIRNETETKRAHMEVLQKRSTASSNPAKPIPGNVSVNFLQHRREWMHDNVTRQEGGEAKPRTEPAEGKQSAPAEEDTVKRRRYHTASDAAVADRFRKRWKR